MGNNNRAKVLLPFLCNSVTDCSRFGQQEIFKEIFKVVDSKSLNQPSKFSTFSLAKKSGFVHGFQHQGLFSLKEHFFSSH